MEVMDWQSLVSLGSALLSLGVFVGQMRTTVRVLEAGFARHETWLQSIDTRLTELNKHLK